MPNKYHQLGFSQNPFPDEPSLKLGNQDPRSNGEIYNVELHETQRKSFDDFFIPKPQKVDVKTVIFLMDHATKRGRGIGKTAFLKRQTDRVMSDLGDSPSEGSAVVLATHVVPNASIPPRKFWQFARLIFETLVDEDVVSLAVARIRALSGKISDQILGSIQTTDDLINKIGDDVWLNQMGISVQFELNPFVQNQLKSMGVRDDFAHAIAFSGNNQEKFRQHFLSIFTDYRWRHDGGRLLFHDVVNIFLAAKFNRGLLLIDEVEKVIPYQNILERRSFVESLRYFLFDGNCASANNGFFGMLLTIHPGIQEMLLPHWNAAGLDRLAPINEPEAQRNTIYFPALKETDAKPLVKEYLKHSRLSTNIESDLSPFDEDAIIEALVKTSGVPGKMLMLLHEVVETACDSAVNRIDKAFVQNTFLQKEKMESDLIDEDRPVTQSKTDLMGN